MHKISDDITFGVPKPEQIKGKTGLEIMRAILSGELPSPPIAKTLNFWITEVESGSVKFEGAPSYDFLNPLGTVHGGWALTLIDTVTGCAAHTTLKVGEMYATVECKSNFSKPIAHHLEKVYAVGNVITRGRKIITAEGKVYSEDRKILAHGTATLIIL